MARREYLTDEQVETEIAMLLESPNVKLAKRDEYVRNRRRQYLYNLRSYEKRGKELAKQGITLDNIEEELFGETPEVDE